jgi:hypothetical protein
LDQSHFFAGVTAARPAAVSSTETAHATRARRGRGVIVRHLWGLLANTAGPGAKAAKAAKIATHRSWRSCPLLDNPAPHGQC